MVRLPERKPRTARPSIRWKKQKKQKQKNSRAMKIDSQASRRQMTEPGSKPVDLYSDKQRGQ